MSKETDDKILEELRKITQLLQKLNEKDRPKYETKIEGWSDDIIWRNPLPPIKSDLITMKKPKPKTKPKY